MQMVLALDAGDMLCKISMPIPENMNYGELERELCQLSKKPLLETIRNISHGSISPIPQDPTQVTFAPKIEPENTKILWNLPAKSLHNLIRGVSPQPGAWCHLLVKGQIKRLKICSAKVASQEISSGEHPGQLLSYGKNLIVACGEGALELLELQLEGKKAISAVEFMRGYSQDQLAFLIP
jgi:methionyl-tRNA formyltransferase